MSHTPTTASLTVTDLRDELEHCRSERTATPSSSAIKRGTTTLTVTMVEQTSPRWGILHTPLLLQDLGVDTWRLPPHIRMVVWPHKFRPHLLEKYDGTVNPTEFLQIYSTSILAGGGNEAVMANYFPVALIGMTRSWLMNLPPWFLYSKKELCRQFTTHFESAYAQPGNEVDLHAVQ
jgi:hypothetical protein